MDDALFVVVAYGVTGVALMLLCLATWRRARRVRQQLDRHDF